MTSRRAVLKAGLAIVAMATTVSACSGIPVPSDKQNYIGEWEGLGATLTITPDGGVNWKRISGSGSRSVTAPLQNFDGANFTVGVWFITTSFNVQKPPYQEGGQWKMVVEGVELTRVRR